MPTRSRSCATSCLPEKRPEPPRVAHVGTRRIARRLRERLSAAGQRHAAEAGHRHGARVRQDDGRPRSCCVHDSRGRRRCLYLPSRGVPRARAGWSSLAVLLRGPTGAVFLGTGSCFGSRSGSLGAFARSCMEPGRQSHRDLFIGVAKRTGWPLARGSRSWLRLVPLPIGAAHTAVYPRFLKISFCL